MAIELSFAGIECSSCKHQDCDGSKGQWSTWEIDGKTLGRCPLTLIEKGTHETLQAYSHYLKGYLPVQGGILDQTSQFVEAVKVIEASIEENRKEKDGGK